MGEKGRWTPNPVRALSFTAPPSLEGLGLGTKSNIVEELVIE